MGSIMRTCPVCGFTIVVDSATGCLLTHGPSTIVGPYDVCPGSGRQVEDPVSDDPGAT